MWNRKDASFFVYFSVKDVKYILIIWATKYYLLTYNKWQKIDLNRVANSFSYPVKGSSLNSKKLQRYLLEKSYDFLPMTRDLLTMTHNLPLACTKSKQFKLMFSCVVEIPLHSIHLNGCNKLQIKHKWTINFKFHRISSGADYKTGLWRTFSDKQRQEERDRDIWLLYITA